MKLEFFILLPVAVVYCVQWAWKLEKKRRRSSDPTLTSLLQPVALFFVLIVVIHFISFPNVRAQGSPIPIVSDIVIFLGLPAMVILTLVFISPLGRSFRQKFIPRNEHTANQGREVLHHGGFLSDRGIPKLSLLHIGWLNVVLATVFIGSAFFADAMNRAQFQNRPAQVEEASVLEKDISTRGGRALRRYHITIDREILGTSELRVDSDEYYAIKIGDRVYVKIRTGYLSYPFISAVLKKE
tara:strand:+ start:21 stop:743 length:723 start_codon:yes stop_codon:yes gene_type:complete